MIRMLAMISIVACHFCQYYNSEWAWWLNVGVQVFFIISGFLYGSRSIDEPIPWLQKRFVKILTPYYIFLTLVIISYLIVSPDRLDLTYIVASYLVVGTIKGINHLWFVSFILLCYLITPYLAAIREYVSKKDTARALCILIVLASIYSITEIIISGHFRPGMLLCYVAGYFTAFFVNRIGEKAINYCFWLSLIPTVISNYVYCHIHYLQGQEMTGLLVHITDYSHAFLGYSITMLLMIVFKNIKRHRLLAYSDRYSNEIYLVHQLFILSPLTLLHVTSLSVINIPLALCAILLNAMLLNKFDKTLSKILIQNCRI